MDVDISEPVFAVVASFDPYFNYIKLMKAVNYLKDESIPFYVTNQDLTFPGSVPGYSSCITYFASLMPLGVIVPGAGWTSIVSIWCLMPNKF